MIIYRKSGNTYMTLSAVCYSKLLHPSIAFKYVEAHGKDELKNFLPMKFYLEIMSSNLQYLDSSYHLKCPCQILILRHIYTWHSTLDQKRGYYSLLAKFVNWRHTRLWYKVPKSANPGNIVVNASFTRIRNMMASLACTLLLCAWHEHVFILSLSWNLASEGYIPI